MARGAPGVSFEVAGRVAVEAAWQNRAVTAEGSVDEQLRFAIANKRLVQMSYKGRVRVAEPHDYGVQKGVTRLLTYQRSAVGGGPRKDVTGWRLLDLPKIERCLVLDETFPGSRGQAHHAHNVWDVLYARVK